MLCNLLPIANAFESLVLFVSQLLLSHSTESPVSKLACKHASLLTNFEAQVAAGHVRIGISGWRYKPWRGVFYPQGLAQNAELSYAASLLNSIEINGTFYSLQSPESFARWAASTPDNFKFSVKGPRYITHLRRLKDVEKPLANFFASGLFRLGRKLGPILWQFPPNFRFEPARIEPFLKMLPHDTEAASALARRRDKQIIAKASLKPLARTAVRHAMEIRHDSFVTPEFIHILRDNNVALVCADTVEWPRLMDVTSDFIYCRLHGSEQLYASGYDHQSLDTWAIRVAAWAQGGQAPAAELADPAHKLTASPRDVFVYFDNDIKVRAPFDAQELMQRVKPLLQYL
jgi:uncharacterized protein YecE (DUF72 family)